MSLLKDSLINFELITDVTTQNLHITHKKVINSLITGKTRLIFLFSRSANLTDELHVKNNQAGLLSE